MGCATPEGATGGNIARQIAHPRRAAGDGVGHDGEPLLLLRPADRGARRAAHPRRRSATSSSPAASNRSRWCRTRPTSTTARTNGCARHKPEIYWPMLQTAEIRVEEVQHPARGAGPLRRREPAARRQVARRGQVQGRDRADHHQDEGGGQGHQHRDHEGSDGRARRGHPRGHHLRGRVADQAGHRGRRDRRGQRQPVFRRRLGAGRDERQGRRPSAA